MICMPLQTAARVHVGVVQNLGGRVMGFEGDDIYN